MSSIFELYLSYKLDKNSLIVSYKVINKSDDKMLFSIGAHPAFNWTLNENEKKEDYFLESENIKQTKSNKIKIIKILVEILVYGFNFSKNLHLRTQDICRIQVTCNI